jgi:hypothetical protein
LIESNRLVATVCTFNPPLPRHSVVHAGVRSASSRVIPSRGRARRLCALHHGVPVARVQPPGA